MPLQDYRPLFEWFASYMEGFRGAGGALPGPLEFKRVHSARVAGNAALIAGGLGLDAEESALARAAGLLHDAGRFNQFKLYASFKDASSLDHGLEGRRVLETEAASLFPEADVRDRLLCAVQYHNRKAEDLPADLPPGHDSLLKLVRDADKIDILEELVDSVEKDGFKRLHAMVPDIKLTRDLTPGVLEAAVRGETLAIKDLFTLADILVMAAGWFNDLNFGPARRLAADRGFLRRIRAQLPGAAGLDAYFASLEAAAGARGPGYRLF
jgi:HD superfamily phosphohydrolase YqeK